MGEAGRRGWLTAPARGGGPGRRQVLTAALGASLLAACSTPQQSPPAPAPTSTPAPPSGPPRPSAAPIFARQLPTGDTGYVYRGSIPMRTELSGRADIEYATNHPALDRCTVGEGMPDRGPGGGVERAEYATVERFDVGRDVWVAFAVNVLTGAPRNWALFAQFHDVPDAGDVVAPPPLSFGLRPGGLGLSVTAHGDGVERRTSARQVRGRQVYEVREFERRRWHHFVVRCVFQRTGRGELEMWHDGRRVVDARLPLGYHDAIGPYFKYGAYRGVSTGTYGVCFAHVEVSDRPLSTRITSPPTLPELPRAR